MLQLGRYLRGLQFSNEFGGGEQQKQKNQHGAPNRHPLRDSPVERLGKHDLNQDYEN